MPTSLDSGSGKRGRVAIDNSLFVRHKNNVRVGLAVKALAAHWVCLISGRETG